jgi:hypothetical protein
MMQSIDVEPANKNENAIKCIHHFFQLCFLQKNDVIFSCYRMTCLSSLFLNENISFLNKHIF